MLILLLTGCPSGADSGPKLRDTAVADTNDIVETADTAETGETGDTTEAGDTAETGDTSDTSGTDSGDNGDTDTAVGCASVNSGDDWRWSGECPQMGTPVVIAVAGCAMTLDYDSVGGMTMGMPYSGTIAGDTVTFADDNYFTGCVGTVATADSISGYCDGSCTFKLKR